MIQQSTAGGRRFGISTYLFHQQRLSREHLADIAGHGFETIELWATRSHFDYRDPAATAALAEWLAETGLVVHSVHAPPSGDADGDDADAVWAVLQLAVHVPYRFLVVHPEPQPNAARRLVEDAAARAAALDVKVAVEVMPSGRWNAGALTQLIEEDLEDVDAGLCFDYGHAHMTGDLGEAIEAASGHVWTTHVHDNRGRGDDHLVPFAGSIDWDLAIMETQKIGYDDVLMFEVDGAGDPVDVLRRSARARERMEKSFGAFGAFGAFG